MGKITDHRHRLLSACSEWPYGCRAAEKGDELAPLHPTTLIWVARSMISVLAYNRQTIAAAEVPQ
jgi:hypothetical protein